MSGPVTPGDTGPVTAVEAPGRSPVEIGESRRARVGSLDVRRALPRRERRTVGAWCFLDHMGPVEVTRDAGIDVGPHPHTGLQTVTWLLAGEAVHRDSLGSEQVIRPGQLNLMTAGHGVAHAEERTGAYAGQMHGVQLWIAQPSSTRDGPAAFEHHGDLPKLDLDGAVATVLVGAVEGAASPARRDTDHLGVDLALHGPATSVPLRPECEYALVVFAGAVAVEGRRVEPGHLAYLGLGRDECGLSTDQPARALLLGGVPFDEQILMWWNFVGRTRTELTAAHHDWTTAGPRFGRISSGLPRIEVGPPPWAPRTRGTPP